MSASSYVYWHGDKFDSTRLLVLGESAYRMDGDPQAPVPPAEVIKAIKKYLACKQADGDANVKRPDGYEHFIKIFQTTCGPTRDISRDSMDSFFDRITYANYVQPPVGDNPGCRPTREQWRNAWSPFREFLDELKPAKILILGMGLWGKIMSRAAPGLPAGEWDNYQFPIPGATAAKVCVIYHPSYWNRHPQETPASYHSHFVNKLGEFL